MASYLKPRRGTYAQATSILKGTGKLLAGEVFFEMPSTTPGTGIGKIKMGDGSKDYADLPYFLDTSNFVTAGQEYSTSDPGSSTTLDQAITALSGDTSIPAAKGYMYRALNSIKSSLSSLQTSVSNNSTAITKLNNDLDGKIGFNLTTSFTLNDSSIIINYGSTQLPYSNLFLITGIVTTGSGGGVVCLFNLGSYMYYYTTLNSNTSAISTSTGYMTFKKINNYTTKYKIYQITF